MAKKANTNQKKANINPRKIRATHYAKTLGKIIDGVGQHCAHPRPPEVEDFLRNLREIKDFVTEVGAVNYPHLHNMVGGGL